MVWGYPYPCKTQGEAVNLTTFKLIKSIHGKWEPDSQKCMVFSPIANKDGNAFAVACATDELQPTAGFLSAYEVGHEKSEAVMEYIAWCLNHPNAIERAYRVLEKKNA